MGCTDYSPTSAIRCFLTQTYLATGVIPSQINENWAFEPTVIKYARNVDTGEVTLGRLLTAISDAQRLGRGFAAGEYLAAVTDLVLPHVDVDDFGIAFAAFHGCRKDVSLLLSRRDLLESFNGMVL